MLQEYPMAATMKGIGMEDQTVFVSPWATCYDDEEFFVQTVSTLGEALSSSVYLCAVYYALVMCSAGGDQDSNIQKIQIKMRQLLYRFLATTMDIEEASEKTSLLISYIEKLHRCGDILFNRMLWLGDLEDF